MLTQVMTQVMGDNGVSGDVTQLASNRCMHRWYGLSADQCSRIFTTGADGVRGCVETARLSHATFSPFVTRVAEQASGLILRKPIQLKKKGSEEEVDQYWIDFMEDCDGHGTDLDSFVRRLLFSSIMFGHAGVLVDFPSTAACPKPRHWRGIWGCARTLLDRSTQSR